MAWTTVLGVIAFFGLLTSASAATLRQTGLASWYGPGFQGHLMANGCRFDMATATAASRTLPLGSLIRVRNRLNDRTLTIEVTDRGPYVPDRVLDVSKAAAVALDMIKPGVVPVSLEVVSRQAHRCHTVTGGSALPVRSVSISRPARAGN